MKPGRNRCGNHGGVTAGGRPCRRRAAGVRQCHQHEECPVCLEMLHPRHVAQLPCQHTFHLTCALDWHRQSPTCALCRAPVPDFACRLNATATSFPDAPAYRLTPRCPVACLVLPDGNRVALQDAADQVQRNVVPAGWIEELRGQTFEPVYRLALVGGDDLYLDARAWVCLRQLSLHRGCAWLHRGCAELPLQPRPVIMTCPLGLLDRKLVIHTATFTHAGLSPQWWTIASGWMYNIMNELRQKYPGFRYPNHANTLMYDLFGALYLRHRLVANQIQSALILAMHSTIELLQLAQPDVTAFGIELLLFYYPGAAETRVVRDAFAQDLVDFIAEHIEVGPPKATQVTAKLGSIGPVDVATGDPLPGVDC